MQGDYLYAVLVVAFDQSVTAATRISSLYSFASVLTGTALVSCWRLAAVHDTSLTLPRASSSCVSAASNRSSSLGAASSPWPLVF
jgi:hypothetical protein